MLKQEVNYVPVSVAAKMMGLSKQRIYQLIQEQRLTWVNLGGVYLIAKTSIDDFIILRDHRRGNDAA